MEDRAVNTYAPVRKLGSPVSDVPPVQPRVQPTRVQPRREPASSGVNPGRNPIRKVRPQALPSGVPTQAQPVARAAQASTFQKLGLFCCCAYLVSGYANDLSNRAFGGKAYLSWIFGTLLLIAFVVSGTAFRGLKTTVGKCWAGIVVLLLFSSAFSMARGDSVGLLKDYIPKSLFFYFYCTAFGLTLANCRTLIKASILSMTAVLGSTILFGGLDPSGRFCIPGSMLLGNSNDFALTMVSSLGFCLYLIWQKSGWQRILGSAEFLLTLYFLLKTGSRGGFLALVACITVFLMFSAKRGSLIVLAVPALCVLPLLPSSTLSRLTEIVAPSNLTLDSAAGSDAQMSQLERTELFKKSISYAASHPVFGGGPGTFTSMLWLDDVAHGTHTPALGTHNSYTQLASECGIPAFILYLCVIFGTIGANYRMMKRTRNVPEAEGVFMMSICLLGSLVAFAVGSAFDHVAYSWTLPVLSGISTAIYLATRGGDPAWIKAEIAAGNA